MTKKNMIIRDYTTNDAVEVGKLIAETYREFNLGFAVPEKVDKYLGPFRYAWSDDVENKQAIIQVLESPIFIIAEIDARIAGILRGRKERLASLFVHKDFHRQGIGQKLVEYFEADSIVKGVHVIRLAATLYAVPFYLKVGYKKSTGLRSGWSFDGDGFIYQPMKKVLNR